MVNLHIQNYEPLTSTRKVGVTRVQEFPSSVAAIMQLGCFHFHEATTAFISMRPQPLSQWFVFHSSCLITQFDFELEKLRNIIGLVQILFSDYS